ncbi:MAG: transcription elongation factor GreA [Clostridia bacterium]|nr:transcription elongation factor GreA [Clostridia bacterium]MBQ8862890.1 transcription elongation factor GreA [Clostridia bacterium]
MAKQITSVTEAGYQKLKEELDYLKNVKRREAAERVGEARSYGDLSENSEYDDAKNEQAKVEAQIAELEETIAHVKIVNHEDINTNVANIGLTVKVLYVEDDDEVEYSLVGSREVDVLNNKISDQSPIGKAIMGTKAGDSVTVDIPSGRIQLKILEVKKTEN